MKNDNEDEDGQSYNEEVEEDDMQYEKDIKQFEDYAEDEQDSSSFKEKRIYKNQ